MVRYSDELIDEIRNRNDIIDIVSQYVVLKRSGRSFSGLCPFHKEKSPSFYVSPDRQIFKCFGCGVGGNVIHFISKIENVGFKDALEILAERAGIQLPVLETSAADNKMMQLRSKVYEINKITAEFYHENLYKPTAKPAQDYVKMRKMDNATLKNFLIGYSGNFDDLYRLLKSKGFTDEEILESRLVNRNDEGRFIDRFRKRLMFPICDERGRVIAFGGRRLDDSLPKEKNPKYINSAESIVYTKGRHLFGLNVAKKYDTKKMIIVEGYMDCISLHQRGIHNAVASLGTAMTEAQGRLLRKSSEQVIIGYDSDGAGQAATMRGLEILQNLGCDVRVLQMKGAKDPDEFVIKYGPERFNKVVDNAISLVEYKIKILRKELDLENTNDKIKFLKEIAKVLSRIDSDIEKEVYVDKLSLEYKISKEAIYAEISKLERKASKSNGILEKAKPRLEVKEENKEEVNEQIDKREKLIIYLLINYPKESYEIIRKNISVSDFKSQRNQTIVKKLYEELEKGNSNIDKVLDWFDDEETINYLSWILVYDFEITEVDKCISDLINIYTKENLINQRNEIIKKLEEKEISKQEADELGRKLNEVIIKLAKMK